MVDRDELVGTRQALHAVAEQVLAAALHRATGRIGLRAAPGGFATPGFEVGGVEHRIAVVATDLVVRVGDEVRRAPLTTLRAAGELVGIAPEAPADVYAPATALDPDAPLRIAAEAAGLLADWFARIDDALGQLVAELPGPGAPTIELWPEHFDLAVTIDEVNYGGSPGDGSHDLPYAYVGPWVVPPADDFWNEPFGASRPIDDVTSAADALAFFRAGRDRR